MESQASTLSEKAGCEVSSIPADEVGKFIVEYENLAKKHMEEQKDLVKKHMDWVNKHENMIKKQNDLEKMYEELLNKYQDLEIEQRDTIQKHEDLSIEHTGLSNKYEELNEKHNDTVKKYDQLVQQLKDKVECPVCLVVPNTAPIPVCPNGHVVCTKCVREDCPKCRVKMEQGKSTLAVTVIENLDHLCENEGCQEIIPFEGLASHSKKCNYRLVTCPKCDVKISLSSLTTHMVDSSCLSQGRTLLVCLRGEVETHKLPLVTNFNYTRNDQLEDKCSWKPIAMRCLATWRKLQESGYRVTIIVHRVEDGPEGSYSQRYCGDVCPIDVTSVVDSEEKGLCLSLTDNAMGKLLVEKSDSAKKWFSVSVDLFGTVL